MQLFMHMIDLIHCIFPLQIFMHDSVHLKLMANVRYGHAAPGLVVTGLVRCMQIVSV